MSEPRQTDAEFLDEAAERASKVLPSAISEIIADYLWDAKYPSPGTFAIAHEVMGLPHLDAAESFYVHGDSGYLWLTHEPCEQPVKEIDAGDYLNQINQDARDHTCPPKEIDTEARP